MFDFQELYMYVAIKILKLWSHQEIPLINQSDIRQLTPKNLSF